MGNKKDRQQRALERLQKQLKSGTKTQAKTNKKVPLSETDIKRIEKEIGILSK